MPIVAPYRGPLLVGTTFAAAGRFPMTTRAAQTLADFQASGPKKSKYGNAPTEIDGHRFASKKEGARYAELRLLEKAGVITDLRMQVAFPLDVNGYPVARYVCDFLYVQAGERVVEDVKSAITRKNPVYRIKRALMRAIHNVDVQEV